MRRLLPLLLLLAALLSAWYLMQEPPLEPQAEEASVPAQEESLRKAAPAVEEGLASVQRENLAADEGLFSEPIEIIEEPSEEFLLESELPPDPLQFGESAVEIKLLDSLTLEPVSGTVQLWRLNAPGNEDWFSGDQLQHTAKAVDGVFRADQLPEGDYRIYAIFAKDGAESGPAFKIEGRSTSLTQEVIMPHPEEIVLVLYRADGTRILGVSGEGFEWQEGGNTSSQDMDYEPSWLNRRWPHHDAVFESMSMGGGWSGGHHRSWKPMEPTFFGYSLGTRHQDSRGNTTKHRFYFREGESKRMEVRIRAEGAGHYVAVYLSRDEVLERILFPAGASFRDLRDAISIKATALPVFHADGGDGPSEQDLLLDVPVDIRINAEGFAPFHITWKMREGRLPELPLRLADGSED
ncbi:MAG: hypothetical protein ACPG31_05700 [Planctomycetota bacterium]